MKILVFEGRNEVIIGDPEQVETLVESWFNDTGRSLEEYNTYLVDGSEGFAFTTDINADVNYEDVYVRDMISLNLRQILNSVGALDDTSEELAAYKGPVAV